MAASLSGSMDLPGVMQLINKLQGYVNRDKNFVCNTLAATNQIIRLCYKSIYDDLGTADWRDKDSYNKLKRYFYKPDIQFQAQLCMVYLTSVRLAFEKHELKRVSNLDVEAIKKIMTYLESFFAETSSSDKTIYQKIALNLQAVSKEEIIEFIDDSLERLERFTNKINMSTAELIATIKCENMLLSGKQ
jgi:hypothetical protein